MITRIFRSIVFATLAVLLATVLLIMGVVYSYFTSVQFRQLRSETALAAHAVANEGISYFDNLDGITDCRITWIGKDGTVLYDNRSDKVAMENHLAREEVIRALESGYGQSTRYSNTLLEQYVYAAQRLPDGTVLRISYSLQSAPRLLVDNIWPALMIIGCAVLLSLMLANRLARQIVKPLNELNLDAPLENTAYHEIYPLLQRLDSQQEQLREQRRELAQRQTEFQTATRALPEGLVLLNAAGTILSINPVAARLLQITPNCIGADFSAANRDSQISGLVDIAYTGKKAEQTISLSGGTYMAAARPIIAEGNLSGVVLLLLDLTQKQKAEALRREFTANVSHELKTPLHAISGYAELMKTGLVQPEDTGIFCEKIYWESQRLMALVEDILRLSRLDEGAADLRWEKADLLALAHQTCGSLAGAAELAGVTVYVTGDTAYLESIPQLLSAIVFNLADNAIKYNRHGGDVTVSVKERDSTVCLRVADTGIGIPETDRERIFERFYRVDKSRSKEVGGTGLGLSIVKHACQILMAELTVFSTPGEGTAIEIIFPKEKQAA